MGKTILIVLMSILLLLNVLCATVNLIVGNPVGLLNVAVVGVLVWALVEIARD